jgi:MoxR-like ATPase
MGRLSMGYPVPEDEVNMVLNRQNGNPLDKITPLLSRQDLIAMQDIVSSTYVKENVVRYIVDLITATRHNSNIQQGASPRATLAVTAMAKAVAQLQGRDYVTPADVRTVFPIAIAHRITLNSAAEGRGLTAEQILDGILAMVKAPSVN